MADFSQHTLNEELISRNFERTIYRTPGGHRLWLAPNKRFVYIPDWGGPYKASLMDEIIRAAFAPRPQAPKKPN